MAKVTLSSIGAGKGDIDLLNANFTAISTAIDNTLSRDGTSPNTMSASLDMNSNRLINLTAPVNSTDAARLQDITTGVQDSYTTTSTTSTTIGTGSKTFTVGSGKFFSVGGYVLVTSDADPTNLMHGQITAYSGTSMTINVTTTGGSGTLADWTITLSGVKGVAGADGPMTGPVSSTDNAITRFDGTSGDTVQDSSVIIDDSDAITGVTSLTVDNINIDGNTIISTDTDGDINLTPNGTGVIVATNNINPADDATDSLGTSSQRFADLYTSGGVYLGGTTSANYLTDYEKGDWTPSLTSTGASFAYTTQEGRYVKIGDFVHCQYRLELSGVPTGTTSNSVFLSGLPFAQETVANMFFGSHAGHITSINLDTNEQAGVALQGTSGGTTMEFKGLGDNITEQAVTASQLGGAFEVRGSFQYIAA